jgi:hypothetical protein
MNEIFLTDILQGELPLEKIWNWRMGGGKLGVTFIVVYIFISIIISIIIYIGYNGHSSIFASE